MIRKLCCVIGLLIACATPAWAAPAVAHQDSWTCALGATCAHTLAFTPNVGDTLLYASTAIGAGNGSGWVPATDGVSCANAKGAGVQILQVYDGTFFYVLFEFYVKVPSSPSTTCNSVLSSGGSSSGSVNVLDISGLLETAQAAAFDKDAPGAWASSISSASSGSVTPAASNEFAVCVQSATTSVVAQTFSGGGLTWTPYLDNSSLGSTDLATGGQYPSTTPFACTSTYTGTFNTVLDIIMFVPAAAPSGATCGPYPWPCMFQPA